MRARHALIEVLHRPAAPVPCRVILAAQLGARPLLCENCLLSSLLCFGKRGPSGIEERLHLPHVHGSGWAEE